MINLFWKKESNFDKNNSIYKFFTKNNKVEVKWVNIYRNEKVGLIRMIKFSKISKNKNI